MSQKQVVTVCIEVETSEELSKEEIQSCTDSLKASIHWALTDLDFISDAIQERLSCELQSLKVVL